jgi:lysozyme family protein
MSVAVSPTLVAAWESAYRRYGQVSEWSTRSPERDPAVAWQMASSSAAVAATWRQIAGSTQLPWWLLAAVDSAAQAFEDQAREWEAATDPDADATGEVWGS